MNSEFIKTNERKFFNYVNIRDMKAVEKWIDEFVADNFINHNTVFGETPDKDGLKEMFSKMFEFFPDWKISIEEMVFENNILCFRHIIHGIKANQGINGIAMIKFRDGKATNRWVTTETI